MKWIASMRGRNPDNPSSRKKGIPTEQRLEPNVWGGANTLTTILKDNLVMEIENDFIKIRQATRLGYAKCRVGGVADMNYEGSLTRRGRVIDDGDTSNTITANSQPNVLEDWQWEIDGKIYRIRIRKLTPRECWRLMGFTDEDHDNASKVNSNTQLYSQAGNSIVVPVLEGIFRNLIECLKVNNQPKRKGKPVPHQGTFGFW